MRKSSRYKIGGVVAVLLALSSVATSAQLAQAAEAAKAVTSSKASLHLSQATNLASGQIITVHGYHFLKKTYVGILECEPGAKAEAQCENTQFATTFDTSATGSFSEPFQVSQDIVVGSTTINCVKTPGCIVAAGDAVDPARQSTGEKISFNPKAKPLVPTLSLSSSKNLTPNETVTVSGKNFRPDSSFQLRECEAVGQPTTNQCDFRQYDAFLQTNARGQSSGTYRVSSHIEHPSGHGQVTVSCEKSPGCALTTYSGVPGSAISAPISFNPKAKALSPSETVSTRSGLVDGQIVTVTVSGFAPDDEVTVQECVAGVAACAPDLVYTNATSAGDVSIQFPVLEAQSAKVSCDTARCDIFVQDDSDGWYSTSRSISFNASGSPVVPGISVTPATGISDGSIISVAVSNFPAGAQLEVAECASLAGELACFEVSAVTADATGAGDTGLHVSKAIPSSTLNCDTTTRCEVLAQNEDDPHDSVSEAIAFS